MKIFLNSIVVSLCTFVWASVYWLGESNMEQVRYITSLQLYKPWIYRQLVPIMVRRLEFLGMRIDWAIVFIVTLSGLGIYLVLQNLLPEYNLEVLGMYLLGIILLGYNRISYDLTTAFIFSLSFLLMYRDNTKFYLLLFPIFCINRETTFLLIIVYFFWTRYVWGTIYQVAIFFGVQTALHRVFVNNDGVNAWIEPWYNILRFINNPAQTLFYLSVAGLFLWLICKDWNSKSSLFKIAFIVMAPIVSIMYLVFGQAFEVRVFWELYPVIVLLSVPSIKGVTYEMQSYWKNLLQQRATSKQNKDADLVT